MGVIVSSTAEGGRVTLPTAHGGAKANEARRTTLGTSLPSTLIDGVLSVLQGETPAAAALREPIALPMTAGPSAVPTAALSADPQALEAARQQAYDEGYSKGEAEGRSVWSADNQRLASLIAEIDAQWRSRIEDAEELAIEIAFAALSRLLGTELAQRDTVIAMVKRTLLEAQADRTRLSVHLSPHDFDFLGEEGRALLTVDRPNLECVADVRVKVGGCLLEMAHGTLDGRIEIQLARLKEAVLDARKNSAS